MKAVLLDLTPEGGTKPGDNVREYVYRPKLMNHSPSRLPVRNVREYYHAGSTLISYIYLRRYVQNMWIK